MRTVHRDKRPVAYAHYEGVTEILDNGDHTGEWEVHYSEPVRTLMNVSGGRGQADVAMFGLECNFARTAVTQDLDTPFDTETVFWVECDPDTSPYNYRVTAVARTINQVVLALAEVDRAETETMPSA